MAAFKFALLFALAFFACQGEAKQIHPLLQPTPKAWDLFGIIDDVIKIVEVVVDQVNEAIPKMDPYVDDLVNRLPPNSKVDVGKLLDSVNRILADVDTEIKRVIEVIENAIAQLGNIQSCTDPSGDALKAVLDGVLEGIDLVFRKVLDDNAEGVNNIILGVDTDIEDLQTLFNDNVARGLECMTPSNADSCTCLDTLKNNVVNGVVALLGNVALHLTFDVDLIGNTMLPQIVNGSMPYVNDGLADAQPLVNDVCTCVAGM